VLRFYCNQQESNRNFKFKPTREIFEKFKFGLDIQMNLWYVVVLEKELILCQQGNYLLTATLSKGRITDGAVWYGIWMSKANGKGKAFRVQQKRKSIRK
jgi:hypothetical protein